MFLQKLSHSILLSAMCMTGLQAWAQISLSTTSLNFGAHTPGNVNGPQTVTLSNRGAADVIVSSIAASGGFSETNNCSTLHAGQSCTINVSFISAIVGSAKGVVTINSNTAASPQIVNLAGNVLTPIALVPGSLSFGTVAVGASATKSVAITDNGGAFAIRQIATSGDYAQTNNCPATLSTGQTCTVNVTFRPRANGARAGVLSITSKDAGFLTSLSGFTASLSGSGSGSTLMSQVSLQPSAVSFGITSPVNALTPTQTINLTNTSSSMSLSVQSVSVLGPISAGTPFYSIGSSNCVGMLAPGSHCSIEVVQSSNREAPDPAAAAGSVMIVDSDHASPNVVPLSASILPEVTFNPGSVTFAPQAVGTTSAPKVVLVTSNIDEAGLSLIPIAVSGGFNLVQAGTNPCGSAPGVGPGTSCTLGIAFSPRHPGTINGAVTFTLYPECDPENVVILHKACPKAQVIHLSGTGQ